MIKRSPPDRSSRQLLLGTVGITDVESPTTIAGNTEGESMRQWGIVVALLGAPALVQCGETKIVSSSESPFMQHCDSDSDCGSLECLCGICSMPCAGTADCGELGGSATCGQKISPELVCESEICV